MPETTRTIAVNGGQFQIELRQGGNGPPLVYLHGAGGLRGWPVYLEELSKRFTVYAPLHPGWGQSTGMEHLDNDIRDLAFFYLDFLDAVGLERAHFVGHSLGGMVALEIAAMDRSYVDKLILVNSAGLWLDEAPIKDLFTTPLPELFPFIFHDPEGPVAKAYAPPEELKAAQEAYLIRYQSLGAAGKYLWPIPDHGTSRRLHRITAPTLILWGESDGLIPLPYAEALRKGIKGARVEVLKEAAHMTLDEQPEKAVELITAFLNGKRNGN